MSSLTLILIAVGAGLVLFGFISHRKLSSQQNRYKNLFVEIDTPLQTRYSLIPKLIETVKAFIQDQDDVLQAVSEARNAASSMREKVAKEPGNAQILKRLVGAENALTDHLHGLTLVLKNHSELTTNAVLQKLLEETGTLDSQISFARKNFNDAVATYNKTRETLPYSIVSTLFEFQPGALFHIAPPRERET